jgi:PhnB protein
MSRTNIYLNFMGDTEEAFAFYAAAFGTQLSGLQRMSEMPSPSGEWSDQDGHKVMHVELPILGGTLLMGTGMLESMGHQLRIGNNTTISLEPDSLIETQRLYDALSAGSTEAAPLSPMPWGAMWGVCLDRYGIRWMFNYPLDGDTTQV